MNANRLFLHRTTQIIIILTLVTLALAGCQSATSESNSGYPNDQLLVDVDWLTERLDDPDLRIIDMRAPDAFAAEHIPGAANIPVGAITSTVDGVPFEFDQAEVKAALAEAGLIPSMTAVIYDNLGMMSAARMFWTLEILGHEDVRVLHGGWNAWLAENGQTTAEVMEVDSTKYTGVLDESQLISAETVLDRLDDPNVVVVDARSPQEYTGEVKLADRGGHIPGAVNLVWLDTLTGGDTVYAINDNWRAELADEDVERFKPADEIQQQLTELNITPDKEVITYCQTLWRGAHVYFLLRLMGYDNVLGYDGSWAEWGNRPDLPVVTGSEPGNLTEAMTQ